MSEEYKKQILNFYQSKRRMPTYSEIAHLLGFKSRNAGVKVVQKLIDAGIISKDSSGKLIPEKSFDEIPMYGLVKAGFPSPAEEELADTISLDDLLIQHKESTFMLKVDGDSMIDAHIADGDMVLVERTNKAKDREIVIAEVDGEFTMKYYREKGGKVWLEPANKNFKPIYPQEELKIAAIVKAVIRQY